jgi:cell division protein FtsZ
MGSATASGANRANEAIIKALDSPLLNDNKIKGAKNVLLLIVSGSEEITIDEIGEINDHIQTEAGHSANIIMGVGEDESLEDSIAVTIIATGFNIEQQNEIVNTESKKIIHNLEDEQKAEHNFGPHKFDSGKHVEKEKPSEVRETKIVHSLEEEQEEAFEIRDLNHDLKTPASARNMDVEYEEVNYKEENFIITNTSEEVKELEVNDAEEIVAETEDQFMFTFDLPLNKPKSENKAAAQSQQSQKPTKVSEAHQSKKVVHDLNDKADEMEVNDPIEIIPVTENSVTGVKRYSLDDYMEVEQMLKKSKHEPKKAEDETVNFEKKTIAPKKEEQPAQKDASDPFDNPISEGLVARAAERRAKMKEFNYKFRNNAAQQDEIEKEPAYKRAGIKLDNSSPGEEKLSRTSLDSGDNDELDFRSNNSFLHDNVD